MNHTTHTNTLDKEIGQLLRALRTRHGLSQLDLAKAMGVHPEHIEQYETGEYRVNLDTILKLCEHYDISPIETLLESPEDSPANEEPTHIQKMEEDLRAALRRSTPLIAVSALNHLARKS